MTIFITPGPRADSHVDNLMARGYDVRVVSGGDDDGGDAKASVLREFACALSLPDWFGHNWDALLDALRDLNNDDGRPIVVVWDRVRTLSQTDPSIYAEVVDILDQVQSERADLRVSVIAR